jgi:hypothetical protein
MRSFFSGTWCRALCRSVGLCALLMHSSTFAQSAREMDISVLLAKLGNIENATVLFFPEGVAFATAPTAETLLDGGCRFTSNDRDKISNLEVAINKADFKASNHGLGDFEIRQGVVLRSSSGATLSFFLGVGYGGYLGELNIPPKVIRMPVTADPSFIASIYQWAAGAENAHSKDASMDGGCVRSLSSR